MTDKQVRQLVALLLGAFPHAKANEYTVKAYERMLLDLDAKAASAALEHLMATSKYMPTIAEIRAAVAEMQRGPVKAGGEAWGDVLRAIGRFGYYRLPQFDDPVTAKCVDAFGWTNLCLSENQEADRARFIQLYDRLAAQERTETVTGALPAVKAMRQMRSGNAQPIAKLLPNGGEEN